MSEMTAQEREAAMAQAMGVPVPAPRPTIGPPAGPPPPPPVQAAAAPPPQPKKPAYSPFAEHDSFGGVNPEDVAAAQAELDHPTKRPGFFSFLKDETPEQRAAIGKGQTIGEVVTERGKDAPPPSPSLAPATDGGNRYAKGATDTAATAAPTGINWGGVGGSVTVPAHEVPLATATRQGALMGAIDAQGNAVDAEGKALEGQQSAAGAVADANAGVERARGVGEIDAAKAAIDAGQGVKERAAKAADESKAYRQRIDEFSEKLAKDKVDPNGMWNNASVPQKITWTLAKMLGAVAQSFLHLPTNQVADELERMAAQDVATQRANHEIGREHMADLNTMYGQALHATGNAEEAQRVATGYALEAIKHQAQAFVNGAQSKVAEAKGKEFISEIGSRIAANGERRASVDEKKAEKGIALNPLAQARTVATGPDMKAVYADARKYVDDQAKLGTVVSPDEAIRWSYKLHTGNDPLRGAGPFAGGAKAEPGSKQEKLDEARTEVQGGIATIDRALESGAPIKQGTLGALWSHVPFADQSKKDALERDKYNAQVKSLVGAAWRMTTGGVEPKNPNLIEEQAEHFTIPAGGEGDDVKRARMIALQQALRDAAGNKGVIFDAAQSGKVVAPTFQK